MIIIQTKGPTKVVRLTAGGTTSLEAETVHGWRLVAMYQEDAPEMQSELPTQSNNYQPQVKYAGTRTVSYAILERTEETALAEATERANELQSQLRLKTNEVEDLQREHNKNAEIFERTRLSLGRTERLTEALRAALKEYETP